MSIVRRWGAVFIILALFIWSLTYPRAARVMKFATRLSTHGQEARFHSLLHAAMVNRNAFS